MSFLPKPGMPSSPANANHPSFAVSHQVFRSLFPAIAGLCGSLALNLGHADLLIADWMVQVQGGHWSLTESPLLEQGLHQFGKLASVTSWLAVVTLLAWASMQPTWRALRRPLAYLVISVLAATVAVSVLKKFSDVDCPWDLARYGGSHVYRDLLQASSVHKPRGGCYPAGHASAGYAWISLYFFFKSVRPRWKWFGLAIGVGAGLAFGIAQQFRGAHFASHDVMTFAVCWLVASICYHAFRLHRVSPAGHHTAKVAR